MYGPKYIRKVICPNGLIYRSTAKLWVSRAKKGTSSTALVEHEDEDEDANEGSRRPGRFNLSEVDGNVNPFEE